MTSTQSPRSRRTGSATAGPRRSRATLARRSRQLAGPLAVGLVAGLATGLATAAAAGSPHSTSTAADASSIFSQAQSRPSAVALPARIARASRGGARTALPPMTRVTRTVAIGPSFSGEASWYGGSFQGRRTASGETFDTNGYTAASKTLPFGTRLQVCHSGNCVVVRVNDRGPYVGGRVLDLTHAAARALGYDGVGYVTATPVARRTVSVVDHAALARQRAAQHRAVALRQAAAQRAAERAARAARARQAAAAAEQARVDAAAAQAHDRAPSVGAAAGLFTAAGSGLVQARRRRTASS